MMRTARISSGILGAVAFLGLSALAQAQATGVVAVRFWSLTDVTRIAIETTGDFHFKSDRAHDPERIYFDLGDTRLKIVRKGQHTVAVGDRLLKQIRIGETQPGVTRVVFDLEGPVEYTASQLSNPDRLIVELRSPGAVPSEVPAAPTVTGSAVLPLSPPVEKTAVPLPVPAIVNPPSSIHTSVSVASIEDPTHARERVSAPPAPALPPAVVPVMRSVRQPETLPVVIEKARIEKPQRPIAGPDTARPANLSKKGEQSLTRVLGLKVGRIVLDAGHGGHDTGTHGPSGYTEKELVLDVTRRLGALIETRMGSEVIYTRADDTFIPLETRTQIANDAKADLFLSIHANSSPAGSSSGVETYYLNFTTSQSALEVAARENATSQKTVYELKDLLQKIALRDKVDESREFASRVQTSMYAFAARNNVRAKDRGVKKAPFVVLIGASMPSVLAEIGFITNPKDENLMKKPEYRQKIAEALYKGLSQYAATLSHFQMAKRTSD